MIRCKENKLYLFTFFLNYNSSCKFLISCIIFSCLFVLNWCSDNLLFMCFCYIIPFFYNSTLTVSANFFLPLVFFFESSSSSLSSLVRINWEIFDFMSNWNHFFSFRLCRLSINVFSCCRLFNQSAAPDQIQMQNHKQIQMVLKQEANTKLINFCHISLNHIFHAHGTHPIPQFVRCHGYKQLFHNDARVFVYVFLFAMIHSIYSINFETFLLFIFQKNLFINI